jgi:hypothetical protein
MFATWSLSEWGTIVSYHYCSLSKVSIRFLFISELRILRCFLELKVLVYADTFHT